MQRPFNRFLETGCRTDEVISFNASPHPPSTVIWHRQAREAWFTGGVEREKKKGEKRRGTVSTDARWPDVLRTKIESVVLRDIVAEVVKQISRKKKKKKEYGRCSKRSKWRSRRERKKGGEEQDASKRVPHESFTKGWHV